MRNQIWTEASGEGHLEEMNIKLNPKGLVGLTQVKSGRKSLLGRHKDPKDLGLGNS